MEGIKNSIESDHTQFNYATQTFANNFHERKSGLDFYAMAKDLSAP